MTIAPFQTHIRRPMDAHRAHRQTIHFHPSCPPPRAPSAKKHKSTMALKVAGIERTMRFSTNCIIIFDRSGRSEGKISDALPNRSLRNRLKVDKTSAYSKSHSSKAGIGRVISASGILSHKALLLVAIKREETANWNSAPSRFRSRAKYRPIRFRGFLYFIREIAFELSPT